MKVKNINGTSNNVCKCESWLAHWEAFSGQTAGFCAQETCTAVADVGAHVQKDDPTDRAWYIIPLCKEHNKATGVMELSDSIELVSANVSQTCGKN